MSVTGGGHPEATGAPEPTVGPGTPSGVGSANEPDLAELTHQMCALTKGKRDPVCTHTPSEVLQRGVSELRRLRHELAQLQAAQGGAS